MYTDPFGLCPDSVRNSDGTCPGGLSDRQFDRAEYAARNHLTPEARDRVLALLHDGKVHAGTLNARANAATGFDSQITVNTQSRNGNIFEAHVAFLGYVLAHESEHAKQFSGLGGLISEAAWRWGPQSFRNGLEDRAYAYGCANSTSLLIKASGSCHP